MTGSRVVFLVVLPVLLDVVYVTGDPLSYVGFVCLCMCRSPVALFCFVAANLFFFLVSAPFFIVSRLFGCLPKYWYALVQWGFTYRIIFLVPRCSRFLASLLSIIVSYSYHYDCDYTAVLHLDPLGWVF